MIPDAPYPCGKPRHGPRGDTVLIRIYKEETSFGKWFQLWEAGKIGDPRARFVPLRGTQETPIRNRSNCVQENLGPNIGAGGYQYA